MSLVPAYDQCVAPNRTHGPPLAFASCNPPAQTSKQATVGTPDAYGGGANAAGHLRLKHLPCESNCPGDSDDILIDLAFDDVRCVPTGARCGTANDSGPADYSGEMRFSFTVRRTDHWNAIAPGGGTDAATVQDFPMDISMGMGSPWTCAHSGSTAVGSTCNLLTTMQVQIPGGIGSKKRTIWELDAVRIYDGGADGDVDTAADNTVYARPGIFIP